MAAEVSGLTSVYHQTLDKKNRTSSQHILMRSLFFPEARASNFLQVIGSAGLCSHPIHHAGFPHSLTGFSQDHYLNKSFAPKPLTKQLLVVDSSLRHKCNQTSWQLILESPELFLPTLTSLQRLAFHVVTKTLFLSLPPFSGLCCFFSLQAS